MAHSLILAHWGRHAIDKADEEIKGALVAVQYEGEGAAVVIMDTDDASLLFRVKIYRDGGSGVANPSWFESFMMAMLDIW